MRNLPIILMGSNYVASEAERKFIEETTYKFVPANNNFLSENFYILNEPTMSGLKSYVEDGVRKFKEDVCGIAQDLVITQSWVARTLVGGAHSRHSHPNSIFSGVVYIECSDNSPLNFYHGNDLFREFNFDLDYTHETPYNRGVTNLPVKQGDFIMFPSWVEHDVFVNPGPKERVVLAFNTFIRGELGTTNFYPSGLTV